MCSQEMHNRLRQTSCACATRPRSDIARNGQGFVAVMSVIYFFPCRVARGTSRAAQRGLGLGLGRSCLAAPPQRSRANKILLPLLTSSPSTKTFPQRLLIRVYPLHHRRIGISDPRVALDPCWPEFSSGHGQAGASFSDLTRALGHPCESSFCISHSSIAIGASSIATWPHTRPSRLHLRSSAADSIAASLSQSSFHHSDPLQGKSKRRQLKISPFDTARADRPAII